MRVELPGLFDLQVNGFGGVDFNAPDLSAEPRRRSARPHARDRRDALSADAHHILIRSVRHRGARAGAERASGDRRDPHGRPVSVAGGRRTRRAPAGARDRGEHRRLQAPAGCRGRPDRAGHARAGSAGRGAAHRAPRCRGRARRARSHGGGAADRSAMRSPPARRWPPTWATDARRCCRGTRT